jgi:hypothetical protein
MLFLSNEINNYIYIFATRMNRLLKKILRVVFVYSMYIIAHYAAANLYQRMCVPLGWVGFLTSPFAATLPQCQALRWVVYNTGNHITAMWILLGAWILNMITNFGPFQDEAEKDGDK